MSEASQLPPEDQGLYWHYGPTEVDPDPAKMWHHGCGGEVLFLKEAPGEYFFTCTKCGDAEAQAHGDDE